MGYDTADVGVATKRRVVRIVLQRLGHRYVRNGEGTILVGREGKAVAIRAGISRYVERVVGAAQVVVAGIGSLDGVLALGRGGRYGPSQGVGRIVSRDGVLGNRYLGSGGVAILLIGSQRRYGVVGRLRQGYDEVLTLARELHLGLYGILGLVGVLRLLGFLGLRLLGRIVIGNGYILTGFHPLARKNTLHLRDRGRRYGLYIILLALPDSLVVILREGVLRSGVHGSNLCRNVERRGVGNHHDRVVVERGVGRRKECRNVGSSLVGGREILVLTNRGEGIDSLLAGSLGIGLVGRVLRDGRVIVLREGVVDALNIRNLSLGLVAVDHVLVVEVSLATPAYQSYGSKRQELFDILIHHVHQSLEAEF